MNLVKIKKISMKFSKQMQQARLHNKLSQKELALKMNINVNIINNYENSSAIPNNNIKCKLEKILNFKFTN